MSLRKKPWNRVNLPVYSISSVDESGVCNMNIITYASQVSMQPKQFVCGIYYNTKTLDNINRNPKFALQLLAADQYDLVRVLGKKSGFQYNKAAYLAKREPLGQWKNFTILSNAIAVMELHAVPLEVSAEKKPDHSLFLCHVADYKNLREGAPLTLDILRQKKLIRI